MSDDQLCPMCNATMTEVDHDDQFYSVEVCYECPYCGFVAWKAFYWFQGKWQQEQPFRIYQLDNGELLKLS